MLVTVGTSTDAHSLRS